MRIGDSVKVKVGVRDPDLSFDIGGWQGRIRTIDGDDTVEIVWDSVTLRAMGLDLVIRCDNANLDWRSMTLGWDEIEKAECRDTEDDVARTVDDITSEMLADPRFDAEG
jgi:hypothetical protein